MHEKTLADFLPRPTVLLSIGINPSLHAVRAGYPFAFARNRFWPALNGSRLVAQPLVPGPGAVTELGQRYGIGFTDVVKRATPGMRGLTARDFDRDAPRLRALIEDLAPAVLWFHGAVAARGFLRRNGIDDAAIGWGEQGYTVAGARVFIAPNPSPANARFALADFIAAYDALAALRDRVAGRR